MSFKYKENSFKYDEKTDKKTNKKIRTKQQEKDILKFCKDAKTLKEITTHFGFEDIIKFKKNYINSLLKNNQQYQNDLKIEIKNIFQSS